jgi:hypothetical protein
MKIQNVEHLEEHITDAFARLTPDVLKQIRHEWERRFRVYYQSIVAPIEQVW